MLSLKNTLIVLLLVAQLCYFLIVSPKKSFWSDEVLTYVVVSKSSFPEMWQSTTDALNTSPPFYFVALWLWKQAAGADPMALRLFSTLCMMAATFIWWLLLARAYSKETATLGVVFCFSLSSMLQNHITDARQYALLSLFMSIACYCAYSAYLSKKLNVLNVVVFAFSNLGLIYTHYFGVLYSAGITGIVIFQLMKNRKAAFTYLLASMLVWATFIPWLPILKFHREVASQCPWFIVPGFGDLFGVLTSQITALNIFLPLILLCLASCRFNSLFRDPSTIVAPTSDRPNLLSIAGMMAGIVVFVYVYSLYVKPVFNLRYMICSYPLWAILITHLSYRYLSYNAGISSGTPFLTSRLMNFTCIAMICCLIVSAINLTVESESCVIQEIVNQGSFPVIDEYSVEQLPRWFNSKTPERFVFLMNTADYGCDMGHPRFLTDVVKNADRMTAMTIEKFLETTDEFYLIDRLGTDWANRLILENHAYQCVRLPAEIGAIAIFHVKKQR